MPKRRKLVQCYLCDGKGKVYVGNPRGLRYRLPLKHVRVFKLDKTKATDMRCPLCYGRGKVEPALDSAFRLVYGDLLLAEYNAVDFFRWKFRNDSKNV